MATRPAKVLIRQNKKEIDEVQERKLPKLALYQAELRPAARLVIRPRPARNGGPPPAQRMATGLSAVPATVPRIWLVVTK